MYTERVALYVCILSRVFLFFCLFHLPDSHPSHQPSMCVKQEPHEASFAPFTPSSVGDSALADILPHQSCLSVDGSTPSYLPHAHSPCCSQYASQPFIAGTNFTLKARKSKQNKQKKKIHCFIMFIWFTSFYFYPFTTSHAAFMALLLCIQELNCPFSPN